MNPMETIGLIAGASGHDMTVELRKRNRAVALAAGKNSDSGVELADHVLVRDLVDGPAVAEFFKDRGVKKVIVATGHSLAYGLAGYLEGLGLLSNLNLKGSLVAKNKAAFKSALAEIGVDTPRYLTVELNQPFEMGTIISEIGLPCVIKSFNDKAQAQLASTPEDLRAAIEEMRRAGSDVLLEQYVRGVECTTAVRCTFKTQEGLAVATSYVKARDLGLKGFTDFRQRNLTIQESSAIRRVCEIIAAHLGLLGLPRFDLILGEDDKIYVLECNSVMMCSTTTTNPVHARYIKLYLEPNNIQAASIMTDVSLDVLCQKMVARDGLY